MITKIKHSCSYIKQYLFDLFSCLIKRFYPQLLSYRHLLSPVQIDYQICNREVATESARESGVKGTVFDNKSR